MWPEFDHVDVLVLLALDSLLAPEDVQPITRGEDPVLADEKREKGPSLQRMMLLTGYSDTHLNNSVNKLIEHGFVRVVRWPPITGWKQLHLYGLTRDGRALLARLFPPR